MEKVTFCINCDDKKPFSVITRKSEAEVRGVKFYYEESVALCKECGEEVYVSNVNDANVQARLEAYEREAANGKSLAQDDFSQSGT